MMLNNEYVVDALIFFFIIPCREGTRLSCGHYHSNGWWSSRCLRRTSWVCHLMTGPYQMQWGCWGMSCS